LKRYFRSAEIKPTTSFSTEKNKLETKWIEYSKTESMFPLSDDSLEQETDKKKYWFMNIGCSDNFCQRALTLNVKHNISMKGKMTYSGDFLIVLE